jgi:hypothetical protein
MSKSLKLLVETSCVPVALAESSAAHFEHFHGEIGAAELWSSVYVRKEFVRRWIRGYIEAACFVEHFESVDDALGYIQEDFSGRKVKVGMNAIRVLLREKDALSNQKSVAKELGRMAVRKLKSFDRRFPKRIPNVCQCKIGAKTLLIDYNEFFSSLRAFVASIGDVQDCPVNQFLDFDRARGRARALLSNAEAAATKAGKKLQEFVTKGATINCARCAKIGDAVIALEQPASWILAHIDKDFGALCNALGRREVPIKPRRTADRDAGTAPPSI